MARWQPDARGRLERAAFTLYAERGYENTTAADIAEHAGLTKRTFFRYYADKREVLFGGAGVLEEAVVGAVAAAPAAAAPLDVAVGGLRAGGALLQERRELATQRQRIIAAHPELQERELIKLAKLAAAVAAALRARGVEDPEATLVAETGVTVFRVAFERWIDPANRKDFTTVIDESLVALRAVTAGR